MSIDIKIDRDQYPDLYGKVKIANFMLTDDVLEQSADLVEGKWEEFTDDRGRLAVRLDLRDRFGGANSEVFSPDEFDSIDHLWRRLYRFWGKLLRDRSHMQLDRINQLVKSLGVE